jgi:HD-GYP domain-containing protein (c-di-GMP phosphodiesterase class II)
MKTSEKKDFYSSVKRSINISYFIGSIIPLSLLVYFTVRYIYPIVMEGNSEEMPIHIPILLVLAVTLSILGLTVSVNTINSSIASIKNLHMKLNSLVGITKLFRTTPYLDVLSENIVKAAIRISSSEGGSLILYDYTGNLKYDVVKGKGSRELKDRTVEKGEGFSGWVVENGKSLISNNPGKDERYNPLIYNETDINPRSILVSPLIHGKNVIGAIEVVNRKDGDFTDEDEKLLHSLADQAAISISQCRFLEIQKSDLINITSILIEAQDSFQGKKGHARSVANYANMIGKKLGMSENKLKVLYNASLLHDVGFLKINPALLVKPSPLDLEKIKTHPSFGYEMLKSISLWDDAAELILSHHERYDGTGYPMQKKGDEIPIGARILCVAEVFDVLTSKTSYKKQIDLSSAMNEILAHSGTQFDPEVVKTFKSALEEAGSI